MATNTRLVTFNAQNVTPQDDGLLYETAIPQTGIIYGASMTVNGTNTIHIATGFGIVRGRFFEIFESDIPVPLSASGEVPGRVIGRLDLANTGDPFVLEAQTGSLSPLRQDADVNIFNGVHEFLLAEFYVNEITISGFQDVHPVVEEGKLNTRWNAGLVPKGDGHPKKKWATDDLGNPAWHTDYMEEILGDFATIEGDTASKAYSKGDFLVKDGLLYKVIAAISAGNALTVGGNIARTDVGTEIFSLIRTASGTSDDTLVPADGEYSVRVPIIVPSGYALLGVLQCDSGSRYNLSISGFSVDSSSVYIFGHCYASSPMTVRAKATALLVKTG